MNLENIKFGTLLMWDAPHPEFGGVYLDGSPVPERLIYPCYAGNYHPNHGLEVVCGRPPLPGWSDTRARWYMGSEHERLRLPTKEESEQYALNSRS